MTAPDLGFTVSSRDGAYPVSFVDSTRDVHPLLASYREPFFLIDRNVYDLHRESLQALARYSPIAVFEATEHRKTLAGVGEIAESMQAARVTRNGTLVVIGGGIVQDVGAFAAAIYRRGIPYVLVPTTLLSMADSGIGSKYGVNLGSAKNQVGGFRAPTQVVVATEFLSTLSDAEMRSGFGEIVKLAIIEGAEASARVDEALRRDGVRTAEMRALLYGALQTKKRYIEADEFDTGIRKTLNYGHTFGHALESLVDHEVPHGDAVAWGIDLANSVARSMGLLDGPTYERQHELLRSVFGRRVEHAYDADALIERIKLDKKSSAGSVELILPAALGDVRIVPTPFGEGLRGAIGRYLEADDIFRVDARAK